MPRLHLFEFNDQPWFPKVLRDGLTGYLETLSRKMGFHKRMAPVIDNALRRSGAERIVDLCSGGGGPMVEIHKHLTRIREQTGEQNRPVALILTDKYPNEAVFSAVEQKGQHAISAHRESVDATAVPAELSGMRTVVNALHHFSPDAARNMLADAVERNEAIVVLDLVQRSPATILTAPLIIPTTLMMMPMVRPMRWSYLLFTYLIPILPLINFWDGLVSHLRAYTVAELQAMTEGLGGPGYNWHAERMPIGAGVYVTVLTGIPTHAPD